MGSVLITIDNAILAQINFTFASVWSTNFMQSNNNRVASSALSSAHNAIPFFAVASKYLLKVYSISRSGDD